MLSRRVVQEVEPPAQEDGELELEQRLEKDGDSQKIILIKPGRQAAEQHQDPREEAAEGHDVEPLMG